MKNPLKNDLVQSIKVVFLATIIALGANYAFAAWTPPPASPPTQNAASPLNVADSSQEKQGNLTIRNSNSHSGNALQLPYGQLKVGLSTQGVGTYNKGQFFGRVGADFYCDRNFATCTAAGDLGGGGGGGGGETDPQVDDAMTLGYVPKWDGSMLTNGNITDTDVVVINEASIIDFARGSRIYEAGEPSVPSLRLEANTVAGTDGITLRNFGGGQIMSIKVAGGSDNYFLNDGTLRMNNEISMGSGLPGSRYNKIVALEHPTAPRDAATKQYVDDQVGGGGGGGASYYVKEFTKPVGGSGQDYTVSCNVGDVAVGQGCFELPSGGVNSCNGLGAGEFVNYENAVTKSNPRSVRWHNVWLDPSLRLQVTCLDR